MVRPPRSGDEQGLFFPRAVPAKPPAIGVRDPAEIGWFSRRPSGYIFGMEQLIGILIVGLAFVAAIAGASYIYAMTAEREREPERTRPGHSQPSTPVH
jgi:hypothetical protein